MILNPVRPVDTGTRRLGHVPFVTSMEECLHIWTLPVDSTSNYCIECHTVIPTSIHGQEEKKS